MRRLYHALVRALFTVLGAAVVLFLIQGVALLIFFMLGSGFESSGPGASWLAAYGPGLEAGRALLRRWFGTEPPEVTDLVATVSAGGTGLALLLLAMLIYGLLAGAVIAAYRLWRPAD
ncbi:MAG: hypothetical protein KatS3mg102_2723 [Planctomycetota bacterium]|nr:MAG: hypothetical protein KatS3mg102_2723 [Planctomycetota bacterium]